MRTHPKRTEVAMFVLLVAIALPALADDVKWTDASFETALKTAKAEKQYVLVDFYTTWCGPCKQLDKETYSDATVLDFMKDMIPVKLDSEKGEGIEISKQFGVGFWPTIMLIDPDGKEIDRIVGFIEPAEFIQTVGEYRKGIHTVDWYEAYLKEHPDDAEAWKVLGNKHAYAARGKKANEAFKHYLDLNPDISGEEKAEAFYSIGEAYYVDKSYVEAADIFEAVMQDFPETEWGDDATTRLARCYYGLGEIDKSVSTYKAYADKHLDDKSACNGFAWFCATRKIGLDEALPVALQAVELAERDPGYLDTLAELYYARGEYDLAIKIGQEALDKEPEDQYFKDQVEKFTKAKEEADKRASR